MLTFCEPVALWPPKKLAEDLRRGRSVNGRLNALAARLPSPLEGVAGPAGILVTGGVYPEERLSEVLLNIDRGRDSFGSEGPSVLNADFHLRTVPPFDELDTSRMSESSWTRCRESAEKGRSKRPIFAGRENRGRKLSVDLENSEGLGESVVRQSLVIEPWCAISLVSMTAVCST